MYQYIRAIVKEPGRTGRWVEEHLGHRVISEIYNEYPEVYLVITHTAYPNGEKKALRLKDVPSELHANQSTLKVSDWLASVSGYGLPLRDELPKIETVFAPFGDAWQAGYDIQPVHRTKHHESEVPVSEKLDLRVTKDGVDYQQLFDECLVTVNGLFHRTNYATDALHVVDGAKSGFHANRNAVGLYRLGVLGNVTTVPIKEEHIHKGIDDQRLGEYAYITIDESVDLEGKSVLLVIGGYLHTVGQVYSRVGERIYMVNFNNYPLPQRLLEMKGLIDMSPITDVMSRSSVNPDQMSVEELYSDEVITALLTLSQSFFVVIDTPDLVVEREQLEFMQLPGRYISHLPPRFPMVVSLGRFAEYWVRKEQDRYVLATEEDFETYYTFETTQWKNEHSIDSTRVPYKRFDFKRAHFLKIGKDM